VFTVLSSNQECYDRLAMQLGWRKTRSAYSIFVMKPLGKQPFQRLKRRWKDNIAISFRIISYENGR
jgi:hypothetical protein